MSQNGHSERNGTALPSQSYWVNDAAATDTDILVIAVSAKDLIVGVAQGARRKFNSAPEGRKRQKEALAVK